MTSREGNLEAPTRHPLDWNNPDFYDEDKLNHEMERVFDICHGCRRCVSLCGSFPTLFDLVDESKTGEVDGVDKKDYAKVVDQCYLCDICYVTKCPYVPPHPWNLDFPHLMLRAKAVKFKQGEVKLRDKVLASTDAMGKLAAIPVVAQVVNAVNAMPVTRAERVRAAVMRRAVPIVTASATALVATLAAERAIREIAMGAAERLGALPAQNATTDVIRTVVTEITTVERIRRRA